MKLRSKIPRRKRTNISPILRSNPSHSIASSHLTREVSCDSSRISASKPIAPKKRAYEVGGDEFRRITRSYYRKITNEEPKVLEVSETSCVESSFSGASKLKEVNQPRRSSGDQQVSGKFLNNSLNLIQTDVVSLNSGLDSLSDAKYGKLSIKLIKSGENRDECSEISNSESNTLIIPKVSGGDIDLECSEHLSCKEEADDNEYTSAVFSDDIQSDVFVDFSSDFEFSDYNSSVWCDSGSQFSERSVSDTSPSVTYQLLLQYRQEFCRSLSSALYTKLNLPDEIVVSFLQLCKCVCVCVCA